MRKERAEAGDEKGGKELLIRQLLSPLHPQPIPVHLVLVAGGGDCSK